MTTSVLAEAGTFIVKVPSVAVLVPFAVPLTATDAATRGEPSLASVTLPVTVRSCANAGKQNTASNKATSVFFMFIDLRFQVE